MFAKLHVLVRPHGRIAAGLDGFEETYHRHNLVEICLLVDKGKVRRNRARHICIGGLPSRPSRHSVTPWSTRMGPVQRRPRIRCMLWASRQNPGQTQT